MQSVPYWRFISTAQFHGSLQLSSSAFPVYIYLSHLPSELYCSFLYLFPRPRNQFVSVTLAIRNTPANEHHTSTYVHTHSSPHPVLIMMVYAVMHRDIFLFLINALKLFNVNVNAMHLLCTCTCTCTYMYMYMSQCPTHMPQYTAEPPFKCSQCGVWSIAK